MTKNKNKKVNQLFNGGPKWLSQYSIRPWIRGLRNLDSIFGRGKDFSFSYSVQISCGPPSCILKGNEGCIPAM